MARQPGDLGATGTDDNYCGSNPPPGVFTKADGTTGWFGDCWCTRPADHDGDCVCEPCRERHGVPSWPAPGLQERSEGAAV